MLEAFSNNFSNLMDNPVILSSLKALAVYFSNFSKFDGFFCHFVKPNGLFQISQLLASFSQI